VNKNYIRGRNAEYRGIEFLKKEGYNYVRGAGSHNIDIVAWLVNGKTEKPVYRFIEVKYGVLSPGAKRLAMQKLRDARFPASASVELWHFEKYGKYPNITRVLPIE